MEIDGISVVIPVYNEQNNVLPLAEEIVQALKGKLPFEVLFVDDASRDETLPKLKALKHDLPELRVISFNKNRGQSAAVVSGVKRARFSWIATLDGDRQNDPRDLCLLMNAVNSNSTFPILCMGLRAVRHDNWLRKVSSKIANGVRRKLLKDDCSDSGCGIKIFSRDAFLQLPLFKNCHRFLPALFRRSGVEVIYVPVSHRERVADVSKYGVMNRLWAGIIDLIGVAWLMRRFIENEGEKDV